MSKQSPDADVAFISALAELLNKNDLTELSVKREYGEDDSLERARRQAGDTVTTRCAAPAAEPCARRSGGARRRCRRAGRRRTIRPSIPAP